MTVAILNPGAMEVTVGAAAAGGARVLWASEERGDAGALSAAALAPVPAGIRLGAAHPAKSLRGALPPRLLYRAAAIRRLHRGVGVPLV